jgi:16S rRNA (guanine1207-N2)-methyltransferase
VRLPKARDELAMSAHLACARLRENGRLLIYGGNDEGIRTAARRLGSLSPGVVTIATRQHGRIVALTWTSAARPGLRPTLADWRIVLPDGWVTYPGLFADGTLDAGTALLIAHLPPLTAGARVLDYGCGPGMIAAAIRRRAPEADIDVLDNDAVALVAAGENVARGRAVLGCDFAAVAGRSYDLIVSNPPLHVGVREDHGTLAALIAQAPRHLSADGRLLLVVQRRVPLDELLRAQFRKVEIMAETGTYRVWSGRA